MKTIKQKIFLSYMLIIVAISAALSGTLGAFIFFTLRDNTYASLESIMESQMNNLDKEIANMDTLALNILYSPITREVFVHPPQDEKREMQWAEEISKMMNAFASPTFPVAHIMLYDFYGHAVGTDSNQMRNIDVQESMWFDDIMGKETYMYLTPPYPGGDLKASQYRYTNSELISLYRIVYDQYGIERGLVEVKQYYYKIFKELDDYAARNTYTSVFVLNEKGEQIYPLGTENSDAQYVFSDENTDDKNQRLTLENSEGKKVLMSYTESAKTGWILCMSWEYNRVLRSVYQYIAIFATVVLLITAVALLNAYYVSVQVSQPIERLRNRIKQLDVSNTLPESDDQCKIVEIDAANHTLEQVSQKLTRTVNTMLQLQQHEMQAKMLALQTQMNPHFLYNSLAVICALAEEKRTDQVIYMCKGISGMLRYIASGKAHLVTVYEEMEYTKQYLDCMKIRYGDFLRISIEIPESMMQERLPKLSIQPLVENSIKSCTCCEGPWDIVVAGAIKGNQWEITVQDNGKGFAQDEVDEFYAKIREIEKRQNIPVLELGGMGLVNVYVRLKIQYEEKMVFRLENASTQGAIVTIGGQRKMAMESQSDSGSDGSGNDRK